MLSPYNPIGCKLLCVYYRFKKILSNVTSSSDVIASFSETATLFSSKMRFSVRFLLISNHVLIFTTDTTE